MSKYAEALLQGAETVEQMADEIERLNAWTDLIEADRIMLAERIAELEAALDTLHAAVFLSGNERGKTFQETIADYHKQRAALQEDKP